MNKIKHVFVTALLVSAFLVLSSSVAEAQIYGGRGIGASAIINNGTSSNYVFADTGQLPAGGGNITISAPSSHIPSIMSTGVLTASTSGALRSSQSVTVANDIDIVVGGVHIRANRAVANSGCICCPGADDGTCGGSSTFNGLTVTDQQGVTTNVSVTGQPNQVVALPNGVGTLTLNQQITTDGSITVNAMRVDAAANGTTYAIIVASAASSIQCIVLNPTPADVTVSGRVLDRNGRAVSRATVTLTDANGNVRTATTNTMGYFSFTAVESGSTYALQASSRYHTFPSQVINVESDMTVEIVAN